MEIEVKSMQQQDDIFQNGELEEINGNINVEQELLEKTNDASKRIIKKAKRLTKGQPSASTIVIQNGHQPWQSNIVQDMKNSRKSRSGYGRGLPKKGNVYSINGVFIDDNKEALLFILHCMVLALQCRTGALHDFVLTQFR